MKLRSRKQTKRTKARAKKQSFDDRFAFQEPAVNKDAAAGMAARTRELEKQGNDFAFKPLHF